MVQIPQPLNVELDDTPLGFGKYKGKTPDEISEIDPGYLVWASKNLDWPVCSVAMLQFCEQAQCFVEHDEEYEHELAELEGVKDGY